VSNQHTDQTIASGDNFSKAYEAIQCYAKFFFNSPSFYSLRAQYGVEDLVQAITVKFLTNGYIDRWNPEKASISTYICGAVRNFFVDCLTAQKLHISLDIDDEEGVSLKDIIPDPDPATIISVCAVEQILANLPDVSRSVARLHSPLGIFKLSLRSLAIHFHHGYTQAEIASYCVNTSTGGTVSIGRISQLVGELREHLKDLFGPELSYSSYTPYHFYWRR